MVFMISFNCRRKYRHEGPPVVYFDNIGNIFIDFLSKKQYYNIFLIIVLDKHNWRVYFVTEVKG